MTSAQFIKLWEIPGGIHPPQNKEQSTQLALGELTIPPQLIIPLSQHIGAAAKPIVDVGEHVLAGQLIATADGIFSANIHASSSGTIGAIQDYVLPHPSGMSVESIVIDTDGKHEWITLERCEDYLTLDRITLLTKISDAGIVGLGGAGFPTAIKLNAKSTQKIDTLIINGAECEPYITADDMLMQQRADEVIAGTLLLSHILNYPARLVIAVEDNKPKAIAALQSAVKIFTGKKSAQDAAIDVIAIPTHYPSGGAKQLIYILTGREIPSGHHSADVGTICVNVATTAAAWRAVRFGEPLISRITTVVGEALTTQRNINALIGTPIDYLLQQHGFDASKASRVVMGGSLMGFTIPDLQAPLIKTTNCLLAASKKELPAPPPAQACIRCGLCAEACPASLLPQQLFWYAQAENIERLQAHNIFDCIECGACSYVCPSKIPLVQYYRAAKGTIRQHVADKEKADRSRQRFEFRQQRIAKEEAEKDAKRTARKKAAEEAKLQLAAKNITTTVDANNSAGNNSDADNSTKLQAPVDIVAAAIANANKIQITPEEQRIKLERMLQAAKVGVANARAPLVARNPEFPITEVQLIQQQSRIKQMELKLADAEKKLADFDTLHSNGNITANIHPATIIMEERSAAEQAIAKAKEKTATRTIENHEEKRAEQIKALESRLEKMRERLAKAEADGETNIAALNVGIAKLEEKLREM